MTSLLIAVVLCVPGQDQQTVRSLSVKNIPVEKRGEYVKLTSFVLNSLSRERKITKAKLDGDYIKFDLADFKIDPKLFDSLKHPYKEMRADWFINNVMVAPNYYKFLGVSDIASFKKLVSYDKTGFKSREAGLIAQSGLTKNQRRVMRTPTVNGYVWESHDVIHSEGYKDMLLNLLSDKYDSIEMLGTLPNGLQAYFIGDEKGAALDFIDSVIAIDKNFEGSLVRAGRSCIVCHTKGVNFFEDTVRKLTKSDLAIKTPDAKTAKLLTNLFATNIGESVKKDQRAYNKAVRATGAGPYITSKRLKQAYIDYYKPVTLEVAAKELNVSKEKLEKACKDSNDPRLLGLATNRPMRREQWEQVYKSLLAIASK